MPHVGAHRVADHERLDAGHHEDHHPHPRIADDLEELLDQHVADAFEHGVRQRSVSPATCGRVSSVKVPGRKRPG